MTPGRGRCAVLLVVAAVLTFALTGGGRISGSDEVTMFELSSSLLRGAIEVPEGATLLGRNGRHYSKNHIGQAVVALPFVATGQALAAASGLPESKARLAARAVASGFNGVVTALLLGVLFVLALQIGASPAAALAASVALGFTTPLWVYAKSFMAEPLQALGLLLTVGYAARAACTGVAAADGRRAAVLCALGVFVAVSAKASMLPPVVVALLASGVLLRRGGLWPIAGLVLAVLGHLAYNQARFGDALESGYGAQATAGAFSTPLWVGLHGLLLSSGKGLAWFAPLVCLAPWGFAEAMNRRARSEGAGAAIAVARASLGVWAVLLLQAATFQHWGGDGSWGPRYLLPALPLAFLAVAVALTGASRVRRSIAWGLAAAGLLVQLGGVGVHYGVQMRVAGDYPYSLPLEHPRFMESSHWNPWYSPISGHSRLLRENFAAHLRGEWPRIEAGGGDSRVGVSAEDQRALWGALDFWWLYAAYAGGPRGTLLAGAGLLALLTLVAWIGVARSLRGMGP